MPKLRSIPGFSAAALAGALFVTCPLLARAQGATPKSPSSTLDLTLDTGAPPVPPAAARRELPSRNETVLPSRGVPNFGGAFRQAPAAAPQVLAQLGSVAVPQAEIRVGRDTRSQLLSLVGAGTNLAVVADGGDWWGVLMVNDTMGWIRKSALRMIDYRTRISVPTEAFDTAAPALDSSPAPPDASVAAGLDPRTTALLREAFTYLGVPYVWAGNTRNGLDCSGFVCSVFGALGQHLPRHSGDQARVGQAVSGTDLRPGDRLYFDMGNRGAISHCGIYIGNGMFIHASTNHGRVDVDSILKRNYLKALVAARRS